ncbi:hypothetical protein CISIN_1g0345512mg, partial [Citrus sinensis]
DLDNKPQINILTWVVKYMVAYANSHAFSYVPQVVREQREEKNCLTNWKARV